MKPERDGHTQPVVLSTRPAGTRPTREDRENLYKRFAELYQDERLSDLKIAERTGVNHATVRRWRKRMKLPNIYNRPKEKE